MSLLCDFVCLGSFFLPPLSWHVTYMEINDFLAVPHPHSPDERGGQPDAHHTAETSRSTPIDRQIVLVGGNPLRMDPPRTHIVFSENTKKRKIGHLVSNIPQTPDLTVWGLTPSSPPIVSVQHKTQQTALTLQEIVSFHFIPPTQGFQFVGESSWISNSLK